MERRELLQLCNTILLNQKTQSELEVRLAEQIVKLLEQNERLEKSSNELQTEVLKQEREQIWRQIAVLLKLLFDMLSGGSS